MDSSGRSAYSLGRCRREPLQRMGSQCWSRSTPFSTTICKVGLAQPIRRTSTFPTRVASTGDELRGGGQRCVAVSRFGEQHAHRYVRGADVCFPYESSIGGLGGVPADGRQLSVIENEALHYLVGGYFGGMGGPASTCRISTRLRLPTSVTTSTRTGCSRRKGHRTDAACTGHGPRRVSHGGDVRWSVCPGHCDCSTSGVGMSQMAHTMTLNRWKVISLVRCCG